MGGRGGTRKATSALADSVGPVGGKTGGSARRARTPAIRVPPTRAGAAAAHGGAGGGGGGDEKGALGLGRLRGPRGGEDGGQRALGAHARDEVPLDARRGDVPRALPRRHRLECEPVVPPELRRGLP